MKKYSGSEKSGLSWGDTYMRPRSHYAEGSRGAGNGSGSAFVVKPRPIR